jgi:hypothetical protein
VRDLVTFILPDWGVQKLLEKGDEPGSALLSADGVLWVNVPPNSLELREASRGEATGGRTLAMNSCRHAPLGR